MHRRGEDLIGDIVLEEERCGDGSRAEQRNGGDDGEERSHNGALDGFGCDSAGCLLEGILRDWDE